MITENIKHIFENWAEAKTENILKLPLSGSPRSYFRLTANNKTAIVCCNDDIKENQTFIYFSKHFKELNINVPSIFDVSKDYSYYLQQDLGEKTLYDILTENNFVYNQKIIEIYQKTINQLLKIQIIGNQNLDYSKAFARPNFDRQAIIWDLNYFKYDFVKILDIPFDEQRLEDDFDNFIQLILTEKNCHFMFRDFQSRNIMIQNNEVFFIDYQGGRKGAIEYDLVSLLFDAKAVMPINIKNNLTEYYLQEIDKYAEIDKLRFTKLFPYFAILRVLQALGAYGYRGLIQKKMHFISSIRFAIKNIAEILENYNITDEFKNQFPELAKIFEHLFFNSEYKITDTHEDTKNFNINIKSFSYRNGYPADNSKHGGGFVFDCRNLFNPGRDSRYKELTGLDNAVHNLLETDNDVQIFITDIFLLIKKVIRKYKQKDYDYLAISFGCTGGKHRSVYCAEKLNKLLTNELKNINITVTHQNLTTKI